MLKSLLPTPWIRDRWTSGGFAGILSFGSVRNYTLISPSSPYCIFDALLRPLAGGTFLIPNKSQNCVFNNPNKTDGE